MCIGCKQRGTTCRSQEYDDDNAPEPGQKSDPPLARRLDRLEQMMERIVDKIVPDEADAPAPSSSQHQRAHRSTSVSSHEQPILGRRESSVDVLEASAASEGPIAALLAMRHGSQHRRGPSELGPILTPTLTSAESSTPGLPAAVTPQGSSSRPPTSAGGHSLPAPKHFWVSTTLRSILPSQSVLEAIVTASTGAPYVSALCYSEAERRQGKVESPLAMSVIPPVSSHPLLLAKKALQILLCIQQLPPVFDWDSTGANHSKSEVMTRLSGTVTLVTSNDELIGYAEGIECLILNACYQANCGNLRKSWISIRRALNMAQMIGIDKGHSIAFRSCDPNVRIAHRSSADVLWYKVVFWERYLSLLLGIPVGSSGNGFASGATCAEDTPLDQLEKSHTVLTALIVDRNNDYRKDPSRQQINYAVTQEIDLELENAAKAMPPGWWDEPRLDAFASYDSLWDTTARLLAQIHHYTLVLMVHVPHMLRDLSSPRYDYSKTTCVHSARELLSRYFSFRTHNVSANSFRRVDFAGLMAGMTLCLSYLGKRKGEIWDRSKVKDDAEILEMTRRRMQHVASVNGDRLSREVVSIIEQLAPIIDKAAALLEDRRGSLSGIIARPPDTPRDLHFNVPYLGSVDITIPANPNVSTAVAPARPMTPDRHGHRRHPSSATGALERMALASPTQSVSLTTPYEPPLQQPQLPSDIGFLRLTPYDDQAPFGRSSGVDLGLEPDFVAGADEWALQGVDAVYWSLLVGSM